jgi:uncharacterized Rmd1/YagE family protein
MAEPRFPINQPPSMFHGATAVQVRALSLGARVAPGGAEPLRRLAESPLVIAGGERGYAVLFRYGALVLFGVSADDERKLLENLNIKEPHAKPEVELVELRIDGDFDSGPRVEEGVLYVPDENLARLQIIAEALAKSVVLAQYESSIASIFDRIEPLAQGLSEHGRAGKPVHELLEHIGSALLAEQRMVGRVEVREKPEALWENAELERFYPRLEREYELRERAAGLERKLDLISRTARTALDLLQQRRNLRVEWYIVVLIVVEILLTIYGMLSHAS